jgi:nucleoside-diphosphate-sugar epimerase
MEIKMRVFVTGASGFIGTALTRELVAAGHRVLGLARSDASAELVKQAGGEVVRGDLDDAEGLAAIAREADGVAHLAFIHDFAQFEQNILTDRKVVEAMTEALEGSGKPFVLTSGTALAANNGGVAVETDQPGGFHIGNASRGATELVVQEASRKGMRGMAVRLPQVHGDSEIGFRAGFVTYVIELAKQKGHAAWLDDGAQHRWPSAHRLDVARLYRLALEKGEPGAVFHAVGEQGIPVRKIAETIAEKLDIPVRALSPEESTDYFGWMAMFAAMDNPSSSAITQATLGWYPTGPGLIEDMRANDLG